MSIIKSNAVAPPPASGGSLSSISEMNSLRFDGSSYLGKTYSSSAPTLSTYTFSLWVKLSTLFQDNNLLSFKTTGSNGNESGSFRIDPANKLTVYYQPTTTQSAEVFRDTSSWYHFVFSTNSNVYINGQSINNSVSMPPIVLSHHTSSVEGNPNASLKLGDWWPRNNTNNYPLSGYLANIHFVDGQALDANSFGGTVSDIWVPKAYSGTYGTNGFHLDFADANNIGNDVSGRGNHWTAN